MKAIESVSIGAFVDREPGGFGNTLSNGRELKLHGHVIARWTDGGQLEISLAGRPTKTTKSRLNALAELTGGQFRVWGYKSFQMLDVPPWTGVMSLDGFHTVPWRATK